MPESPCDGCSSIQQRQCAKGSLECTVYHFHIIDTPGFGGATDFRTAAKKFLARWNRVARKALDRACADLDYIAETRERLDASDMAPSLRRLQLSRLHDVQKQANRTKRQVGIFTLADMFTPGVEIPSLQMLRSREKFEKSRRYRRGR